MISYIADDFGEAQPSDKEAKEQHKYTSLSAVFDEYDPFQPFDYEAFRTKRKANEEEEKKRRTLEKQRRNLEFLRHVSKALAFPVEHSTNETNFARTRCKTWRTDTRTSKR